MGFFNDTDKYYFHQGTNYEVYKKMGAHLVKEDGAKGVRFIVWAPHATDVSVVTDAEGWDKEFKMESSPDGIWEVFVKGLKAGTAYKFIITGPEGEKKTKSDPYAFSSQLRPDTASIVVPLEGYEWNDSDYMSKLDNTKVLENPMAIYEVHLGSWKKSYKGAHDKDGFLNYRELADDLVDYVKYMGYTHVELMGICEYPYDPSWGYQVTGMYAPTSRYGTPDDFRAMIDTFHQSGISVILDWVPAHFPKDDFALDQFDGTHLYESEDPLRRDYPIWGTNAYDHSKPEVRSFLVSSAFYWINEFHIDALRVDAVEAMLYADFGRKEFRPNIRGGRFNLESGNFIKQLCSEVTSRTKAYIFAEDSSVEQGITEDIFKGGLGFTFKWNLGWMHDTLSYLSHEFEDRRNYHNVLTHTADYAFSENFVLVLSHDDVSTGKKSIVTKQPGNYNEQFGEIKTLYTLLFTHPGKKLLFMGQDYAQIDEWDFNKELDWHLIDDLGHRNVMLTVKKLISLYKEYSVLHVDSKDRNIFEWVNRGWAEANIISFIRKNPWNYEGSLLVVCNFSPWYHFNHSCGAPVEGDYERIFSTYDYDPNQRRSDRPVVVNAQTSSCDGMPYRLNYGLRPFEAAIFKIPAKKTIK